MTSNLTYYAKQTVSTSLMNSTGIKMATSLLLDQREALPKTVFSKFTFCSKKTKPSQSLKSKQFDVKTLNILNGTPFNDFSSLEISTHLLFLNKTADSNFLHLQAKSFTKRKTRTLEDLHLDLSQL